MRVLGFNSWGGFFSSLTCPEWLWCPPSLLSNWYCGVKWPEREADPSPPSSVNVNEFVELYFHIPNTPSWRGVQLKHRGNFTFEESFIVNIFIIYMVSMLWNGTHHCQWITQPLDKISSHICMKVSNILLFLVLRNFFLW
jgi:hypothetical protein